ncbi:aldo/keto reductase [Opitutaceae bacterium EW11]|nr:aldo/keto reductase [Opitutaceae bacterium EW11]
MHHRTLGRTGLSVSELCLGTLNFGWSVDRVTSEQLLDRFVAEGGNFIQSAGLAPASPLQAGWTRFSESYVGDWLSESGLPRSKIVLSTRLSLAQPVVDGTSAVETLGLACDDSLRRLRTDYIDLLICHWHPAFSPLEALLEELTKRVQSGKIRYFGFAGFPFWRVMESIDRSTRKAFCRLEAFQADYSLLERDPVEREGLDLCRDYRIAFLARSPLAGGFLAARVVPQETARNERDRWLAQRYGNRRGLSVYSEVESIAAGRQASPAGVALAWVLRKPTVTSAVIGARSVMQLRQALEASGMALSHREILRLDGLSARSSTPKPYLSRGEFEQAKRSIAGRLAGRRIDRCRS